MENMVYGAFSVEKQFIERFVGGHLILVGTLLQVCSVNERFVGGQSLLGLVDSRKAHLGIQILRDTENLENDLHMIFSMKFMKQLTKQIDKLQFHAVPTENQHVEKVYKEFVDITPSSPNSYELRASIYSSLSVCPPSKVCVVEITE